LSQSLALYPKVFPELLVNVIESGESSGMLVEVIEQFAGFSEKQAALKQKVVSALTYPIMIIGAAIALMTLFLTYLLPKFVELFEKSDIALPLPTQILVKVGNFFKYNSLLVFIVIGLLIAVIIALPKFKTGKVIIDKVKIKLPYIGSMIKKLSISRFTRTLGTLYSSGVKLIKSLDICEKSTGNIAFVNSINAIKDGVTKGKSFASLMKEDPLYPTDVVEMVAIGESSGNLSDMLYKIADFYERDVDTAVKRISSIIEPMIILFVGIIVGFLAYSIIMPIFNLMHGI